MTVVRTKRRRHEAAHDGALITSPVLVVEDIRSVGEMAATMIHERWGCDVVLAQSLAEVKAALAEHGAGFTAAVCDVHLPDCEPGEALAAVSAAGVPIIAVTASLDDSLRAVVETRGVVDYLLKEGVGTWEYVTGLVGRIHRNRSLEALVVHGAQTLRETMAAMLRRQKLSVVTAATAQGALALLTGASKVRLVLVSHQLPDMDGPRLAHHLRRVQGRDRLAIIGVQGNPDTREAARFLKSGASDLIAAPFSYEELFCRVNQNFEMLEHIEDIRHAASSDFLTGLRNRRAFFEQGLGMHRQAVNRGDPLVAAILDLDHFKRINDTYGHEAGDDVLRHVSAMLKAHFPRELVARLGGEEFGILFAHTHLDEAQARLEAYRLAVEATLAGDESTHPSVTVSIGCTGFLDVDLDAMLAHADQHLFVAKRAGRNRVEGDPGGQAPHAGS